MAVRMPMRGARRIGPGFRIKNGLVSNSSETLLNQHGFKHMIGFNAQPAITHFYFYVPVTQVITGAGKGLPVVAMGFGYGFNRTRDLNVFTTVAFQKLTDLQRFSSFEKYLNLFASITDCAQSTFLALVVS